MASILTVSGGSVLEVEGNSLRIGNSPPSPAVWYDFSDISTLFQDDLQTTPVTTNGDKIGSVVDKTGNGEDVENSAAFRPEYLTNAQNGLSVGDFLNAGSVQRYLSRSSGSWTTIPRPWSMFVVGRTPATIAGANPRSIVSAASPAAGYFQLHIGPSGTTGGAFQYRSHTGIVTSVNYPNFATVGALTWYIWGITCTTSADVYVNDVFDVSLGAGEDLISGFTLGHDADKGADNFGDWQGYIAECRIYGVDLTALGFRTTVYNELRTKWGL